MPNIVVERHPGSSLHPRAIGFTETTLEHFRMVGIADQIPQAPPEFRLRRVTATSLAGKWSEGQDWTPGEAENKRGDLSPHTGAAIAQDKLEPILRQAALARGAELRPSTELVSFQNHDDHIVAHLKDRADGSTFDISCNYMIAADGANSQIREHLKIERNGVGHLRTVRSVLFYCQDADQYLAGGAQQFEIEQENFRAFLTTYGDSRWVLMFPDDSERNDDELRSAIRRALGRDMAFEILTTGRWEMAGRIATTYQKNRVFLAGDAAHQLPPTRGGFGANTGIDDVWNLTWKLQRVLHGRSGASLLDTYSSERQPIGWLRHQQTFSRPDYKKWVDSGFDAAPLFSNEAMEFGQLVRSFAVIGAAAGLPAAASPEDWKGQPGTRAPHIWLTTKEGNRISSLDLFGDDFLLLAGSPAWKMAANEMRMKTIIVGCDIDFPDSGPFSSSFSVLPVGAVLIRPDGIIGWRSRQAADASSFDALKAAWQQINGFSG